MAGQLALHLLVSASSSKGHTAVTRMRQCDQSENAGQTALARMKQCDRSKNAGQVWE